MFWRKKKKDTNTQTIITCPSCKRQLELPTKVIKDFSPGGGEFHPGGTSSIVCPLCNGLIELH